MPLTRADIYPLARRLHALIPAPLRQWTGFPRDPGERDRLADDCLVACAERVEVEAAEANKRLVAGQTVRLELDVERRDHYGRLLAYVYVGDLMVNAELVRQGYAQVATFPPNVKYQERFRELQREAREAGRGLWGR